MKLSISAFILPSLLASSALAMKDKSKTWQSVNGDKYYLEKRLHHWDDIRSPQNSFEVYRVHEESDKSKHYALKLSHPDVGLRETKVYQATKDSKHILQSKSAVTWYSRGLNGDPEKTQMQVLELTDGTLQEKRNSFNETESIYSIWSQLVMGVYELHSKRFIHNDLTPGNVGIMPGEDLTVKLKGFERSFQIKNGMPAIAPTYTFFSSPHSMAPEKIRLDLENRYRVGFQSDIWSLGMILYDLIYKKGAFDFVESQHRKGCIVNPGCVVPTRLLEKNSPLAQLDRLVEKCLARDMFARPTIYELIEETAKIVKQKGFDFAAAKELVELGKKIKRDERLY